MELYFEQWHVEYQWRDILVCAEIECASMLRQILILIGQVPLLAGKG